MRLASFILSVSFVGLTAALSAVGLWWREARCSPAWLVSRPGLGPACLLVAGASLVTGTQIRLSRWNAAGVTFSSLSPRFVVGVAACLAILAVGVVLHQRSRLAGAARHGALLAACAAVAMILLLIQFNVMQGQLLVPEIARVQLDTPGVHAAYRFAPKYQFKADADLDWLSRSIPSWERALAAHKGQPNLRYLEIGLYEGRSFVWMLENVLTHPTARLTGIDPFFDPLYEDSGDQTYRDVFYANLRASGGQAKTDIIEGYSQVELRKLPLNTYDIIYIDGSHNSRDVLEDTVLCWRLLKDGGILIIDDYALNPSMARAVDTFAAFFHDAFDVIHVDFQVILKKTTTDPSRPRPWL